MRRVSRKTLANSKKATESEARAKRQRRAPLPSPLGKAVASNDLPGAVQPCVHRRGVLSKSQLAQELRAAAVMAYPNTFTETFCASVADAQVAGLPVTGAQSARVAQGGILLVRV